MLESDFPSFPTSDQFSQFSFVTVILRNHPSVFLHECFCFRSSINRENLIPLERLPVIPIARASKTSNVELFSRKIALNGTTVCCGWRGVPLFAGKLVVCSCLPPSPINFNQLKPIRKRNQWRQFFKIYIYIYRYAYVYISINKFQVNVEVARASHIKGSTLVCSQTNVELGLIACLKCMHVITDLCPCVQTRVSSLVV